MSDLRTEVSLGEITSYSGAFKVSFLHEADGRACFQIYAHDPSDRRTRGEIVWLDEQQYRELSDALVKGEQYFRRPAAHAGLTPGDEKTAQRLGEAGNPTGSLAVSFITHGDGRAYFQLFAHSPSSRRGGVILNLDEEMYRAFCALLIRGEQRFQRGPIHAGMAGTPMDFSIRLPAPPPKKAAIGCLSIAIALVLLAAAAVLILGALH